MASGERVLLGNWIERNGYIVQDETCKRIQILTECYFEQVSVDGDNWFALYRNPADGNYWKLTYPQSHMHGGGPPRLQLISQHDARIKYLIDMDK